MGSNRLRYVEPTNFFQTQEGALSDSINYPYEDYNIAVELTVSKTDRYSCGWWTTDGGRKEYVYSSKNGTISFLGGSKEGNGGDNYLTTNYTDISMTDPENNANECLGIESINITYNSWIYPQVVIKFVDVRGGTVMLPAEKGYYNENMISNSSHIYKSLFSFPYPLFTLKVKGLYGKGTTYRLTIENTQFDFDANTGNFNITVSFVGYMFRIYTDMPITFLTIAPYMKSGKEYWKQKIDSGEFKFRDVNGNSNAPMITIPDLKLKIAEISKNQEVSSISAESTKVASSFDEQYETLSNIQNSFPFRDWFMPNSVNCAYKVFKTVSETEAFADSVVEYVSVVSAYDATYKTQHLSKIKSLVKASENIAENGKEAFLESSCRLQFRTVENGSGGTYELDTNFVDEFINKGLYGSSPQIVYDTYVSKYNEVKEYIETARTKLNTFCLLIFERKGDYFNPEAFCASVSSEQKTIMETKKSEVDYYKAKEEGVIEKVLGFRPSIKNIYDLMFAHMDTFIHCFYASTKEIKRQLESDKIKRSKERYGIKNGDTDTEDVGCGLERAKYLPPYAAFYKDEYYNGQHRKVLRYPEELRNGSNLEEVKFVKEMLDGAEMYIEKIDDVNRVIDLMNSSAETESVDTTFSNGGAPSFSVGPFIPLTTFDFIYKDIYGNPYRNIATKVYTGDKTVEAEILITFILRAFYYLNINQGEITNNKDAKAFGKIEAINLFKAVKDKYTDGFIQFITKYADGKFDWFEKLLFLSSLDGDNVKTISDALKNNATNLNKALFSKSGEHYFYTYHKGFNFNDNEIGSDGKPNGISCSVSPSVTYKMLPLFFSNIAEMQKYYTEDKKMLLNPKMLPTSFDSIVYGGDGSAVSTFVMYEARDYIKNIYTALEDEISKSEEEIKNMSQTYGNRDNTDYGGISNSSSTLKAYKNNIESKFNGNIYLEPIITKADGTDVDKSEITKIITTGTYEEQSSLFIKYPSIQTTIDGNKYGSIFYTNLYNDQTDIKAKAFIYLQSVPIIGDGCGIDEKNENGLSLKVKLLREGSYYWKLDNPNAIKFTEKFEVTNWNGKITSINVKKPGDNYSFLSRPKSGILNWFKSLRDDISCIDLVEKKESRVYHKIEPPKGCTASRRRVLKKYFEDWATSTDEVSGFAANEKRLTNRNLYSRALTDKGHGEFTNIWGEMKDSYSSVEKRIKEGYDESLVLKSNDRRFSNGLDIVFMAGNNDAKYSDAYEAKKLQAFLRNLFFTICTTLDLYNNVNGTMKVEATLFNKAMNGFMDTLKDIYGKTVTEYKEDSNSFQEKMAEAEANNPFNSPDLKLSTYSTLKNLYDKWLSNPYNGPEKTWALARTSNSISDFDSFKYADSFYNDIGYILLANVTKVSSWLNASIPGPIASGEGAMLNNMGQSLYEYLAAIAEDSGGMLMALPHKFGLSSADDVENMFKPLPIDTDWDEDGSTFIFMYTYKPSQMLGDSTTSNVDMNGYSPDGDGLDLTDEMLVGKVFSNSSNSYTVPAFAVTYAKQNQSIFKNIQLTSKTNGETEASIAAKMNIASKSTEAPRETTLYGQDIYKVLSNYAFNCSVETMGNSQIAPLMYFQLNNIPFWRGAYMIMKVSHNIVAGNMSTTFDGVRINKFAIPLSDGNLAIHKDAGETTNTGGTTDTGGSTSSSAGGGYSGGDVAGNPSVAIAGTDTIDFDVSKISARTPLICVTPAHGPKTDKKDEWEWSTNVVDKMVEILKSYKYSDGTPYQVQRCNKGGLHTGRDGYSMKETKTLINKLGSQNVVSLVPHWNGGGHDFHGAYVNKASKVVRPDSRKLAECIQAVVQDFVNNKPADLFKNHSGVKEMMNGRAKVLNLLEGCSDGAPDLKCACVLTENWFADYPSVAKWKSSRKNWPNLGWGWITSDIGIETIARLNAEGIKRYVDGLKNAPLVYAPPMITPSNTDWEAKAKALGYVDIKTQPGCQDIVVEIKYATSDNIIGRNFYGNFNKAYVHQSMVEPIRKAHAYLKPFGCKLKIWDALRPNEAQRIGRNASSLFGDPIPAGTTNYTVGSYHIYGTAIDCTIVDFIGKELNMGTGMDAWVSGQKWKGCDERCKDGGIGRLVDSKKVINVDNIKAHVNNNSNFGDDETRKQIAENRALLYTALVSKGGLTPIKKEWWHFQISERHNKPLM